MGTFYGSIHLRDADTEALSAALAAVPDTSFFVGTAYEGWTPVYPSGRGQEDGVSLHLAGRLRVPAVHVGVHDSDVFFYAIYRDGALVDEYSSMPDYFGPVDAETEERLQGHPERFADLFAPGTTALLIRAILDRGAERVARPEVLNVKAELSTLEHDMDRLKASPELQELRRELRAQAEAILPARFKNAPDHELVLALAQDGNPQGRAVLAAYQMKLLELMKVFASSTALAAALVTERSPAEQAADAFAQALGLRDALTSYEDLAEAQGTPFGGRSFTHVAGKRVPSS